MHFIQNSLFVVYGAWLLSFLIGVVGIILYVQNRQKVLNKIAIAFCLTFLLAITTSLIGQQPVTISQTNIDFKEIKQTETQVESPAFLNIAFKFLGGLLSDKISN